MTSHIEIAQAKRESENCVRELEGKILKINQESQGRHMCRQKTVSLARARAKSRFGTVPPES